MFLKSRQSVVCSSRRGVALLVTIILLAFLVLIMVAMSSMVRVETQVAVNHDAVAQARQNALTGLNIALGKLQETAGPDQRVTARADLFENDNSVIQTARHYQMNLTGVWDSKDTNPDGSPKLITWLVNGNENLEGKVPFIAPDSLRFSSAVNDPQSRIFDVSDDNSTEHPSSESLYNDSKPAAVLINTGAASTDFRFGDGRVYLVANGSLDVDSKRNGLVPNTSYKHAIRERVVLRKTPIVVDGGKLPGKASGTNVTVGNYAYWVGDAGIKASLAASNRAPDLDYQAAVSETDYRPGAGTASSDGYINRKMLHSLQLQGGRIDLVFGPELLINPATGKYVGYLEDIFASGATPSSLGVANNVDRTVVYGMLAHPLTRDAYARLFTANQIQDFIAEGPFTQPALTIPTTDPTRADFKTVVGARLKQLYHHVTPQTFSVQTNMLTGGLRTDLSQDSGRNALSSALKPGIDFYTKLGFPGSSFSVAKDGTAAGLLQRELTTGAAQATPSGSDTAYPIAPVISEFSLVSTVTINDGGAERVSGSGQVELWNPYNATLKMTNPLHVRITIKDKSGTTSLEATNTTTSTPSTLPYSAEKTFTGVADAEIETDSTPDLLPGEVKSFTFTISERDAKTTSGSVVDFGPDHENLEVSAYGGAEITVDLVEGSGASSKILATYSKINLEAGASTGGRDLYYEFKMRDWATDASSTAEDDWMDFDPRGPVLGNGAFVGRDIGKSQPGYALDTDVYSAGEQVILFDVPRQEVLSVGSLRHVVFKAGQRLYSVGRANAGAANNLFEEYFFSSVPRNQPPVAEWTPVSGKPLANTSTVIFDPTPGASASANDLWNGSSTELTGLNSNTATPAQYMLVRDTLNVNSTSDVAWRTLLGGALPTLADPNATGSYPASFGGDSKSWDYVYRRTVAGYPANVPAGNRDIDNIWAGWRYYDADAKTVTTEPVHNAFFRFPHTSTDVVDSYAKLRNDLFGSAENRGDALGEREKTAFKLGVRELARTQVEELAWWVAYRVKNPGAGQVRPFKSITQFINEGVLDYAIGKVGSGQPAGVVFPDAWKNNDPINNPGQAAHSLPKGSAAYLTQSDILELVGHRLFARSDTFTIRAYGDVTEPTVFASGAPKVLSRVWVEATVQRLPIKHPTSDDPDDNMKPTYDGTGSQVGNFGRQFRIINLRWLRPEEI